MTLKSDEITIISVMLPLMIRFKLDGFGSDIVQLIGCLRLATPLITIGFIKVRLITLYFNNDVNNEHVISIL